MTPFLIDCCLGAPVSAGPAGRSRAGDAQPLLLRLSPGGTDIEPACGPVGRGTGDFLVQFHQMGV